MAKSKKGTLRAGSMTSGVGLTVLEMSADHFKAHKSRVLSKMRDKGASVELMKAATNRIEARRAQSLKSAKKS